MERRCPTCGSGEKQVLFTQHFVGLDDLALLDGYDVAACSDCGFFFADGIPAQEAFESYYRLLSKYEYQDQGGRPPDSDEKRFSAVADSIGTWLPDTEARILDIGCSTGGLLQALYWKGYQRLLGIDPSPLCCQIASSRPGIQAIPGTIFEAPSLPHTFDLVILAAVLEHIRDLREALAWIRSALAKDGLLLIQVPDARKFPDSQGGPFQEFSTEHINFFSETSLGNLLEACGFLLEVPNDRILRETPELPRSELWAVFRIAERGQSGPVADMDTREAVLSYVTESYREETRTHQILRILAEQQEPLIVWGTGTHTQRLLAMSPLQDARIAAFVDSNPRYWGASLKGIPVLSPADLKNRAEAVLISSKISQAAIERQLLEELHIPNEVIRLY